MWIDGIALALLAYFVVTGALRGAFASFLRISALVVSYVSTYLFGPILAPILATLLDLSDLVALAASGILVFLLVFILLGAIASLLQRQEREAREGDPRSGLDRSGGALLGALQGGLVILLLGVLTSWIEVGQKNGGFQSLPSPGGQGVAKVTRVVVEGTADALLDEQSRGARVAVRFAVRPDDAISDVQSLIEAPAFRSLQDDRLFWSYVEHGSIDQALNQRTFLDISHDPELRQRLADLGMIPPEAAQDPSSFRTSIRDMLERLSPRIRAVRNDPALQELAQDPEIARALQEGDTLPLLSDPRLRAVMSRALETPAAQ